METTGPRSGRSATGRMAGTAPLTPLEPWITAKIGQLGSSLSLKALRSYQLAKLNETLSRVQSRSAFYRRSLGAEKIVLSSLEELAELPFSTPCDLAAAPLDFLCVRHDDVERIVTLPTSGTTGAPKRIFFSAEDQELTRDFFRWGMSTMVEAGDRVLILLPGSLPGSVGDLLRDGLARMAVVGIPHGPVTDPRHTLELIRQERVTALVGIPVQVLSLARLAASDRSLCSSFALHSVLLSTDRVPHAIGRAINDVWGCAVYNHYGMTEMGLGGAVDCQARAGYHLREADLLFEIIDPFTGKPVPDGERGEVVFTTLTRSAMPLVRYRTGDVSRFIPGACPCGTVLKRLAHVEERLEGGIALDGGQILSQRDFDEALFSLDELTDFKVVFASSQGRATLRVYVRHCDATTGPSTDEVVKGLLEIPPLSHEVASGSLSLEVRDWGEGDGDIAGAGKRKIMHIAETGTPLT